MHPGTGRYTPMDETERLFDHTRTRLDSGVTAIGFEQAMEDGAATTEGFVSS